MEDTNPSKKGMNNTYIGKRLCRKSSQGGMAGRTPILEKKFGMICIVG